MAKKERTDPGVTSKERTDLLGYLPSRTSVGNPDQYLKTSDFYTGPETTNADYYPGLNRDINVGSSPSRYFGGGIPIFTAPGGVFPWAAFDARQKALREAALKSKLYQQDLTGAAAKGLSDIYQRPEDINMVYNEQWQKAGLQGAQYIVEDTVRKHGGNKIAAYQELQDFTSPAGSKLAAFIENHKTYGNTIKQMTDIAIKADDAVKEGQILPEEFASAVQEFKSGAYGRVDEQNPTELKMKIAKMGIMANTLPTLNAFVGSLDTDKIVENGYYVEKLDPKKAYETSLNLVRARPQEKPGVATSFGLPLDAKDEVIAQKLADYAVNAKGIKRTRIPTDGNGAGDGKLNRFTWDKESLPNAEVARQMAQSNPYLHRGYSLQYLSSGGETPPTKSWDYQYSIDPLKGKVTGPGTVTGSLVGVNPVYNTKERKLEWTAIISDPAHTETVTTYYKTEGDKSVEVPKGTPGAIAVSQQVTVPEKLVAIPYEGNEAKVEVHTRNKHGQEGSGLSLSQADYDRVNKLNQEEKKSGGNPSKEDPLGIF